jgi:plastocyanin
MNHLPTLDPFHLRLSVVSVESWIDTFCLREEAMRLHAEPSSGIFYLGTGRNAKRTLSRFLQITSLIQVLGYTRKYFCPNLHYCSGPIMNLFYSSVLLACATMTSSSLGAEFTIDEWIIPSDGGPYPPIEVNVGDTITFAWTGFHTVQINPSMSCDATDTVVLGDTSPTTYTFLDADGSPDGTTHLFVCGVGGHCEAGKSNA